MKKLYIYIIGAMALAACSDNINYDMPDNVTDQVQFTVGNVLAGETLTSRAEEGGHTHAVTYDPTKHPNKLGVFASYGSTIKPVNMTTGATQSAGSTSYVWKSDLYWPEISDQESIDFVGYMYETTLPADAELKKEDGNYKLSFTASLAKSVLLSSEVDKAPLVCCRIPESITKQVAQVNFDMDRTLTGYSVWFQLGDDMDRIRDFEITEVSIYGSAPTKGTVNVTYKAGGEKTITWSDLREVADFGTEKAPLPLTWGKPLTINQATSGYQKWGESGAGNETSQAFFAIPSADFNPYIKVKYNVIVDNDGATNAANQGIVTREGVVSTIQFNQTNFTKLTKGQTGKVNPIKIKIVPSYLYVLADEDQTTTGYITLQ